MAWDQSDYINLGTAGMSGLLGGIFGGSDPYKKASKQYQQYANQAAGYQNPFYNMGQQAMPEYQKYIQGMQDPSQFINNLMGQYQESPMAHNLQQQSMRAGTNAASAAGLTGSTPLAQQLQKNASDISSQDQQAWLQNVLGINTQYGQGLQNQLNYGQGAANQLSDIYSGLGRNMADMTYGSDMARRKQLADLFGGGANLAMLAFM